MARPIKHGPSWRIRWTDTEGRRHSEALDAFREAELALRRRQVEVEEIRRGERPRSPRERTFNEICDYWLEHRAPRKRSRKNDEGNIRNHLRPAFGPLRMEEITTERVDEFVGTLHLSTNTVHNVLTLLVSLLKLAHDMGWLLRRPVIRKPKLRLHEQDFRYLRSEEEIRRFLAAAQEEGEGVFALFATAVFTGMRAGELAALLWTDVDFERRLICCQRSYKGPTKSGSLRWIPILDVLLPILREWRLRCPFDVVFPNERGNPHTQSARIFQETFARVLDRAGFPRDPSRGGRGGYIRFHDLRHTAASHWMMNNGDIFKLEKILGHADGKTTRRYAHLAPSAFADDLGRFAPTMLPAEAGDVVPLTSSTKNQAG